jgi:aconitate hydratase
VGPLPDGDCVRCSERDLVVASVLSGNRNFEGRINPHVKANYLASPPLVVAYALAGTVDIDLQNEPLGTDADGQPVYLKDIWPTQQEMQDGGRPRLRRMFSASSTRTCSPGRRSGSKSRAGDDEVYDWDETSTYIQHPPFFAGSDAGRAGDPADHQARCLALLGDSVTTDHISPAGPIEPTSPAGRYLQEAGVEPEEFNSYGSRRGQRPRDDARDVRQSADTQPAAAGRRGRANAAPADRQSR